MGGGEFILSCGRVILRNNTNKNNNCSPTNMMDDHECFDSLVIDSLLICLNLYPECFCLQITTD